MLCPMERKVGKYTIEAKGYFFNWILHLLPSIEVSWDEAFFGVRFSFLFFNFVIDVTDEEGFEEWVNKITNKQDEHYDTGQTGKE